MCIIFVDLIHDFAILEKGLQTLFDKIGMVVGGIVVALTAYFELFLFVAKVTDS